MAFALPLHCAPLRCAQVAFGTCTGTFLLWNRDCRISIEHLAPAGENDFSFYSSSWSRTGPLTDISGSDGRCYRSFMDGWKNGFSHSTREDKGTQAVLHLVRLSSARGNGYRPGARLHCSGDGQHT